MQWSSRFRNITEHQVTLSTEAAEQCRGSSHPGFHSVLEVRTQAAAAAAAARDQGDFYCPGGARFRPA